MDIMRDLLTNGFIIYSNNGDFIVKKEPVPNNTLVIKEQKFNNYEAAIAAAVELLKTPPLIEWEIIVRYNQGLGVEYKNLPTIFSKNQHQAKLMAEYNVSLFFEKLVKISEIKVRPKN